MYDIFMWLFTESSLPGNPKFQWPNSLITKKLNQNNLKKTGIAKKIMFNHRKKYQ